MALREIRRWIEREGVECALIILTLEGYINWAAGCKLQLKDIRPEWRKEG